MQQSSPPKLGGVAAPSRRRSRSEMAQTGWFPIEMEQLQNHPGRANQGGFAIFS